MFKKISAVSLALVVLLCLSLTASAYTEQYVVDYNNCFSYEEIQELETYAESVENEYGCCVMLCVTDEAVSDGYAEEIYNDYTDNENGFVLVHSLDDNSYYYFVTDSAKSTFNADVYETLKNAYDSNDTYFDGAEDYYSTCVDVLESDGDVAVVPETNYNATGDGLADRKADTVKVIVICIAVGMAVGFLVMFAIASKNKSVRMQKNASVYTRQGSFIVTGNYDNFLYKNVDKTPKPKQNNNNK
ncbi:MAG: TPM domain-containing protein [Clostridia bacterium]|nr:TPM domain-containing protein [Clostridia bacterium]